MFDSPRSVTKRKQALFHQSGVRTQDEQSPSSFITALPPSFLSDFPTVSIPLGERIHKSNCVIEEFGEKGKREFEESLVFEQIHEETYTSLGYDLLKIAPEALSERVHRIMEWTWIDF